MKSIFIRSFRTIQEALDAAIAVKGREKIIFMMAASMTVPRLRKRLIMRPRRFIHGSRLEIGDIKFYYEDSVKPSRSEKLIASLMEGR